MSRAALLRALPSRPLVCLARRVLAIGTTIAGAAAIGAMLAYSVPAKAESADPWTGPDKVKHVGVSAGFGVVASGFSDDKRKAWGACMVVGLGKEVADRMGLGQASAKDLAADALGCALGVATGRALIRYSRGRAEVLYRVEF